jgi:hypothetical protein
VLSVAQTLRLLEEYPDGLTEAVVLTELTSQLHHRERLSFKQTRMQCLEDMLEENDEAVIDATVTAHEKHCIYMRLTANAANSESESETVAALRMFLHQRFRACMAAFASLHAGLPHDAPFLPGRQIVFTDAKLLEKNSTTTTSVLPTPYLALRLTASDNMLQAQALTFAQVDVMASQELPGHEAPSLLQELVVKAQVVDISAIRPCKTPYHVQRQVIMLTDVTSPSQPSSAGSHVLILWDDQVALSRLFHVGDTLTLLHPFIHVCAADDTEIVSVYEEYSSQQRCVYYLEYGTATTIFVSSRLQAESSLSSDRYRPDLQPGDHHSVVSVGSMANHWIGFSLYGQVAKIQVSHGVPLLAAFFYAYYDPKTQGRVAGSTQRPALDRAVVSKYYLVVLIDVYDAISKEVRTIELTGQTAGKALQLRVGQTIFIEGLVAVDLRDDPTIRSLRDETAQLQRQQLPQAQDDRARFAFPNRAYKSPIVALSSDWESIFGHQSDVFTASKLFVINEIPGVISTRLPRHHGTDLLAHYLQHAKSTRQVGMVAIRFTVTKVGWLVPEANASVFAWDESCERGFSTMLAHRACKRPLETAPSQPHTSAPSPRWKCGFCNEIFAGMDATVQTYCNLVLRIDDGSLGHHHAIHALCHGDTVSILLGVPAEAFSQLSLPAKRSALRQAMGKDYNAVLSRCPPQQVTASDLRVPVELRVDQLHQLDAFATAQTLLAQLTKQER